MIDLLNKVTVNSKDNGNEFTVFDRINVIKSLLTDSDYNLVKEGKLSLIYAKQPIEGKDIVIISSHIDCVFDKCFCYDDSNMLHGTFDNSLTNSAVLWNMLNNKFNDNVAIAFTGDEEVNCNGCLETICTLHKAKANIKFAVVTDVTEEGWKLLCPFTIENDLGIDIITAHRIIEKLNKYNSNYILVHNAEPDESWDYAEHGIPSLTLCLPILGDMHSNDGVFARKESLPIYCEALRIIANTVA